MIEYEDAKNKVTLVRSKSDAPLSESSEPEKAFAQIDTRNETSLQEAASLKEPCSDSPIQLHLDNIMDAEEAYISKDLGVSSKEVLLALTILPALSFLLFIVNYFNLLTPILFCFVFFPCFHPL